MKAIALQRVSLTVTDLAASATFYGQALGFIPQGSQHAADPALAQLLGAGAIHTLTLRRGHQTLELACFDPPGQPYPASRHSNDAIFQHIALVTNNIAAAYATLNRHAHTAISRHGPQALPGGIVAYKFRDADGHPLELIQFPNPNPATANGIDHSAIVVANADASIAFYATALGLTVASRQRNTGPAQDALDDLDGAAVDVVALNPAQPAPHVELLAYRTPAGQPAPIVRPADQAASRLVLQVDHLEGHPGAVTLPDGSHAAMMHDPDGHALLLLAPANWCCSPCPC